VAWAGHVAFMEEKGNLVRKLEENRSL